MGSRLTFLLLFAILELTTATVNIKGTPENVTITWEMKDDFKFTEIEVFLNNKTIIQEPTDSQHDSNSNPANFASCQFKNPKNQKCTIINAIVEGKSYNYAAAVTWTSKYNSILTEKVNAKTKSVCVLGRATKPEITKQNDGSFVCKSTGFPAPIIKWTDGWKMQNDIAGTDLEPDWKATEKRYLSSSTYTQKKQDSPYNVTCTATVKQHDNCTHKDTSTLTNFEPTTKPVIKKLDGKLECTSTGYPAPIITWMDAQKATNTITGINSEADKHSSSTYTPPDNEYFYVICIAKQHITFNITHEENANYSNFEKLSQPKITNKTKDYLTCESHGVPAPKLIWVNNSNALQKLDKIEGKSLWNFKSIHFNATNINMYIRCYAEQYTVDAKYYLTSDPMELRNSASKIGGINGLVAALVAVAFFTRS